MKKQYENLTLTLSNEIVQVQSKIEDYNIRQDIDEIISNNGNANDGIINFKIFAADLNNYISNLPENVAKELKIVNNLALEVLKFKEQSENVNAHEDADNEVNEFFIPDNIQF